MLMFWILKFHRLNSTEQETNCEGVADLPWHVQGMDQELLIMIWSFEITHKDFLVLANHTWAVLQKQKETLVILALGLAGPRDLLNYSLLRAKIFPKVFHHNSQGLREESLPIFLNRSVM